MVADVQGLGRSGTMANYDFTYKNDEWVYAGGWIAHELTLHLERWSDGQIHLQHAEDAKGHVIQIKWLDDAIREWVQNHQHKLEAACIDYMEENLDAFGAQVDYYMEQAR
jgi:hypothetical protein